MNNDADSGTSLSDEKLEVAVPPEGCILAGWLYLNDDGYGPFFSKMEQKRYLNEWPVFSRIDTTNV